MFTLNLDKDNYILSISHTQNDNVNIDLSTLDLRYLNAYKYENSKIILDEKKKAQLIAEEEAREKADEIAELTEELESTNDDMLAFLEDLGSLNNPLTFISDLINLAKKYATLIATRKSIREQIAALKRRIK